MMEDKKKQLFYHLQTSSIKSIFLFLFFVFFCTKFLHYLFLSVCFLQYSQNKTANIST